MRRREFITLIGGMAAAWPLVAHAQQSVMPLIGFMSSRSPEDSVHLLEAFRRGLKEGGFSEGQNVAIEFRWARGDYSKLPALAADLVSRRVNVLTAVGGDPSPLAAKRATSTIPIVFGMGGDPVSDGLVESFNRPGGNVTGVTLLTNLMEPKRLGLLRELAPGVTLIGALVNPAFAPTARQQQQLEEASRASNLRLVIAKASTDDDLDAAFAFLVREGVGALVVAAVFRYTKRPDRRVRGTAAPAYHLSVPRIRGRRRTAELWRKHHRCLPAVRRLHCGDSQGRQARGLAGPAGVQVRAGGQPQDREGARPQDL
jgi:putative ABC transport system substrate-binding protein